MDESTRIGEDKERATGYSIDICEQEENDGRRVLTLNIGISFNKAYEIFTALVAQNIHRPTIVYIRLCYRPAHGEPWHVLTRKTSNGHGDW